MYCNINNTNLILFIMTNRIPEGLRKNRTEFFTDDISGIPELMVIHNLVISPYKETPADRLQTMFKAMKSNPLTDKAMEAMVGPDENDKLEQFIKCNYSRFDDKADITEVGEISPPEYVACPKRATCQFNGIGCRKAIDNLSPSETLIFENVLHTNKEIAGILFLSTLTVNKHLQNIRKKTGLVDKADMSHYATIKGII